MFYTYCYKLAIFKIKIKNMNKKLNGFNDGLHPSSGIGGGKGFYQTETNAIISEYEYQFLSDNQKDKCKFKTYSETTQLSGLSDYELELEKIVDKIKSEPSTLRCIQLLKTLVGDFGD